MGHCSKPCWKPAGRRVLSAWNRLGVVLLAREATTIQRRAPVRRATPVDIDAAVNHREETAGLEVVSGWPPTSQTRGTVFASACWARCRCGAARRSWASVVRSNEPYSPSCSRSGGELSRWTRSPRRCGANTHRQGMRRPFRATCSGSGRCWNPIGPRASNRACWSRSRVDIGSTSPPNKSMMPPSRVFWRAVRGTSLAGSPLRARRTLLEPSRCGVALSCPTFRGTTLPPTSLGISMSCDSRLSSPGSTRNWPWGITRRCSPSSPRWPSRIRCASTCRRN